MRHHFILIALPACSTGARVSASDAQGGHVSDTSPLRSGIVLFSHSGARTTAPGCSAFPARWSLDASTQAGQAALSVLLTAHSLHEPIRIVGPGTCFDWNDTEAANYIVTVD
jgi:hypothetical protein